MGYKLLQLNIPVFILIAIQEQCLCDKIKLYQTDGRVSVASKSQVVRSLLECSALFGNNIGSKSFSYNEENKICELSNYYPDGSTTTSKGWKVYAPIGKYFPFPCFYFSFFVSFPLLLLLLILLLLLFQAPYG